jgi:hypothetical protein
MTVFVYLAAFNAILATEVHLEHAKFDAGSGTEGIDPLAYSRIASLPGSVLVAGWSGYPHDPDGVVDLPAAEDILATEASSVRGVGNLQGFIAGWPILTLLRARRAKRAMNRITLS